MKAILLLLFVALTSALSLGDLAKIANKPDIGVTQHYGYINVNKTMNANMFYWYKAIVS